MSERGNCYLGAVELLKTLLTRRGVKFIRPDKIWLVHGIPTLSVSPYVQFGHAWVEAEISPGVMLVYDHNRPDDPFLKDEFYAVGKIQHAVRYTPQQAITLMDEFGTPGPWDERVAAAAHASDFDIA